MGYWSIWVSRLDPWKRNPVSLKTVDRTTVHGFRAQGVEFRDQVVEGFT